MTSDAEPSPPKYSLSPWNRGITNDELLADLQRVAKALGKSTVRYEEYPKMGRCSSKVFETRFGSWNKALVAAGLDVGLRQNMQESDFFENLERVWRTLGRQPVGADMVKPVSAISKGAYEKKFGTWRKALEAFVAAANSGDIGTAGGGSDSKTNRPQARTGSESSHRTSRAPSWRLRYLVMRRDNFKCRNCGKSPAQNVGITLHLDHDLAWSKGGETTFENLVTLCSVCNGGKSDLL